MQESRVFCDTKTNHIRKNTASLLTEVCKDIQVELPLQQLLAKNIQQHIRATEFRLDRWVVRTKPSSIFDVRVFNPKVTRYTKLELSKSYKIKEKEKKNIIINT